MVAAAVSGAKSGFGNVSQITRGCGVANPRGGSARQPNPWDRRAPVRNARVARAASASKAASSMGMFLRGSIVPSAKTNGRFSPYRARTASISAGAASKNCRGMPEWITVMRSGGMRRMRTASRLVAFRNRDQPVRAAQNVGRGGVRAARGRRMKFRHDPRRHVVNRGCQPRTPRRVPHQIRGVKNIAATRRPIEHRQRSVIGERERAQSQETCALDPRRMHRD